MAGIHIQEPNQAAHTYTGEDVGRLMSKAAANATKAYRMLTLMKIQPIGLREWREATSAPTTAKPMVVNGVRVWWERIVL